MTADAIRSMNVDDHIGRLERFKIEMLQEIAAQLAEFNERCSRNCIPTSDLMERVGKIENHLHDKFGEAP